jgi:pyroglutamyl-peptidase
MNIVVTGFERFHTNSDNPTLHILKELPSSIKGHQLHTLELPVLYDVAFHMLQEKIEEHQADIVICLGLAQGRTAITPERVAINVNDASIPDNNGVLYTNRPIVTEGATAYFSSLPIYKMIEALQEKNIPVKLSNSAGTYVCNNIMYHVLHYVHKGNLSIKAGFIHVPLMDEQEHDDNTFSMPLSQMVEGIMECIKASI